jgi:hypothetical protein
MPPPLILLARERRACSGNPFASANGFFVALNSACLAHYTSDQRGKDGQC